MEMARLSVDLPVEGHMPSVDGATGWLNSPPLAAPDLGGKVVLVELLDVHLHQLAPHARLCTRMGGEVREQGLIVVGVHTPEFPFERDVDNVRRAAADAGRVSRSRSTATMPSGRPSTTRYWPAVVHRRRARDESGITSSARADTRSASGSSSGCCARPGGRASPTISSRSRTTASRRKPTGRPWGLPRPTSATSGASALRLPAAPCSTTPHIRRAGAVEAEPVGSLGRLDRRESGERARTERRANRVPLPRPRRPPGPGAAPRGASVPFRVLLDGEPPGAAHGLDVDDAGSRNGRHSRGCISWFASPARSPTARSRSPSLHPGVEAYAFTFG